jgi:rubrerythrin
MTPTRDPLRELVRQLQRACSGELAAGYAYRGHAQSLPKGPDRDRIQEIEVEEWHHRTLVLNLLRELDASPARTREFVFWCIGRAIGVLCHFGGWFIPMYGAGRLERANIVEYEEAAVYAAECGRTEMIDCILTMAEVEWEHERFFRERLTGHKLLTILPLWKEPPPKHTIRRHSAREVSAAVHVA